MDLKERARMIQTGLMKGCHYPEDVLWFLENMVAADRMDTAQSAILAEREECAKIAENGILNPDGKEGTNLYMNPYSPHRKAIAKAIRARSQSAPQIFTIPEDLPKEDQILTADGWQDTPQPSNKPAESPKISFAGIQPD